MLRNIAIAIAIATMGACGDYESEPGCTGNHCGDSCVNDSECPTVDEAHPGQCVDGRCGYAD